MRTLRTRHGAALACLTAALVIGAAAGGRGDQTEAPAPAARTKVFLDARIFDGTRETPVDRGAIVVRDGRILAVGPTASLSIPPDAERIDVAGRTILPGLVNTHGHVGETDGLRTGPDAYSAGSVLRQLALYARYGVTTVFSLGGGQPVGIKIRNGQATPNLDRSRFYMAGPVVDARTPQEAREQVGALARMGVDVVKIRVDDNLGTGTKMPTDVYQTVIEVAHRHNLRVAVHIFYLEDAIKVLRAGADYIAHSVRDTEVTGELVDLLKARDLCYCPTLTRELSTFAYAERPAFFDEPFFRDGADPAVVAELERPDRQVRIRSSTSAQRYREGLEMAKRNLARLSDAGVRIAFGTDTGPLGRFQGYFEHVELEMMVESGLTPYQALKSATSDAATCVGLEGELGVLAPGAWADLIVLAGNPLDDIRNTRTIESVWIAGNRVPGRSGATGTE